QRFTLPNVAAIYRSSFAQGFSSAQRNAAARGTLRHNIQNDDEHLRTRNPGGLHPLYIYFNSPGLIDHDEFLAESTGDIFDALTTQDRLDGGISVLLRCRGADTRSSLSPEDVAVDVYITPRELHEHADKVGETVATMVQT
ncbi:hypothetical protein BJ138DRAFT_1236290, partial [Hygrophoropsis aurantiaca]